MSSLPLLGWWMRIGSLHNNFFLHLKTKSISILVESYLFCDIVYSFTTSNPLHNSHLNKYSTILLVYALFYVSLDEILPKKLRHFHYNKSLWFALCFSSKDCFSVFFSNFLKKSKLFIEMALFLAFFAMTKTCRS
jgi:hypothetical protein